MELIEKRTGIEEIYRTSEGVAIYNGETIYIPKTAFEHSLRLDEGERISHIDFKDDQMSLFINHIDQHYRIHGFDEIPNKYFKTAFIQKTGTFIFERNPDNSGKSVDQFSNFLYFHEKDDQRMNGIVLPDTVTYYSDGIHLVTTSAATGFDFSVWLMSEGRIISKANIMHAIRQFGLQDEVHQKYYVKRILGIFNDLVYFKLTSGIILIYNFSTQKFVRLIEWPLNLPPGLQKIISQFREMPDLNYLTNYLVLDNRIGKLVGIFGYWYMEVNQDGTFSFYDLEACLADHKLGWINGFPPEVSKEKFCYTSHGYASHPHNIGVFDRNKKVIVDGADFFGIEENIHEPEAMRYYHPVVRSKILDGDDLYLLYNTTESPLNKNRLLFHVKV